jgi:hypothetical protein
VLIDEAVDENDFSAISKLNCRKGFVRFFPGDARQNGVLLREE